MSQDLELRDGDVAILAQDEKSLRYAKRRRRSLLAKGNGTGKSRKGKEAIDRRSDLPKAIVEGDKEVEPREEDPEQDPSDSPMKKDETTFQKRKGNQSCRIFRRRR